MFHTPRYVLATQPRAARVERVGVLVIGAGAAGLSAALVAAERADVTVLVRGHLPESNSALAQGGIAAALDAHDSPRSHIDDTLVAGAGLSDWGAVSALAYDAPDLMRELAALGVPFERSADDRFALGLEGGHSMRRIVHVGDATGWAVTEQLIAQAQAHPRISIREGWQAADLLDAGGRVVGVMARDAAGTWSRILADATILATGGAGALYGLTSNQPVALGEGIAMAYRAGAEVADMEFVQFHPTVYRTREGQGFLITEAARGEGGHLRTLDGERFMPAYDPRAELAPRDVVTRGIYAAMRRTGSDHVLLDLTHLPPELLAHHFPTISARLREDGIDIATTPIPVAPASHYLMGGVRTDLDGATSLPGLYAAGEVSCTGVHGANRLASNSLLECLVFGRRAGEAAARIADCRLQIADWSEPQINLQSAIYNLQSDWRSELAEIMVAAAGPLRDSHGLRIGQAALAAMPTQASPADGDAITAANAALTARLIVESALLRQESRGGHFRSDFPQTREDWHAHTVLRRGQSLQLVETIAPDLAHAAD
ncbi:L-aspartate oxidase [Chloroflexales bacterium ZM16-3]|nr:L-aspartate oxidase [Chloroflexales bacterium ZM16-3]